VGDAAAAALARSLKQLRHLDLSDCCIDLSSIDVLEAVGQLAQLTALLLTGNSGLTQQGLLQLTGLTALQRLKVDRSDEVTNEVVESFWAAVRECRT
jgi:hypothetical protein